MIVEQRTYTALPGKWRDYLALYQAEGLEIQLRVLGRMVGYYTTESGPLNQICICGPTRTSMNAPNCGRSY